VAQKVITKAEAKRNKAEAIKRGEITYDDTPCSKCGNTERYVNSGKCVNCHKERNKRRKSRGKAGKTGKSRAAPALAGAGLVPVTPITDDWQSYADRITATFTATLQKTVEGFIATGALLIEAKAKVDHGDWLKLTERLPFSVRTAQMLIRPAVLILKKDTIDRAVTFTKTNSGFNIQFTAEYEDELRRVVHHSAPPRG
jgi:Protein of unknown function (DUF3102)